jgi:nucleoside-diphosphate-sugar epimerase
MKVLVTGGAGFIGSNLVKELLLDKGNHVRVLDDLSGGSMNNLGEIVKKIEFIKGSITDADTVKKACSNVDVIFHLAAKISVEDSIKNPLQTNSVNIGGTLNLLSSAKANKVKRVIFSSSAAVYGSINPPPIKETAPVGPESPYALQKYVGEKYCQYFSQYYGLDTVCLRYFNVYGPYQQESGGYAGVIYKFIKNALKGETINIEGDGEQTRDFIFVGDIVKANIAVLGSLINFSGNVYNIGTGKETSVKQLFNIIKELSGNNVNVTHSEQRLGDIKRSCANIELAKKELAYVNGEPLQQGLKKTIEWVRG